MSIILLKSERYTVSLRAQLILISILITSVNSSQIILSDQFLSISQQRFSLGKSLLTGSLMLNKVQTEI